MSYKVVRDAANNVVCFGPNDDNYEPMVVAGQTLAIEPNQPVIPPSNEQQIVAIEATITPRNLRMAALGDAFAIQALTDAEAAIAVIRSAP